MNALGAYIAQRLHELGISRSSFAERVGFSRSSLYRLLGPDAPERIDDGRLARMADVLRVEPGQLEALWSGAVWSAPGGGDGESLVRSFVLANAGLSVEELRAALEVAQATADMLRRRRSQQDGAAPRP